WFSAGNSLSLIDDLPQQEYTKRLQSVTGLKEVVKQFHPRLTGNQQLLFMEFVLHGLSEFSQLNKNFLDNGFAFSDMFNSLFDMQAGGDEESDFDEDRY
ncbi:MAG: magnesium chelatase, partial [Sphingobacteriaceae bacterium]